MTKKRSKHGRPGTRPTKPQKPKAKPDDRPKGPTQAQRLDAARQARRQRRTRLRVAVAIGLIVIIGGVAVWQIQSRRAAQRTIAALTAGTCRYDTKSDPGAVNQHTPSPTFRVDPPSGGLHEPSPASGGIYTGTSVPPDGRVVHALEHGLIAISYRPGLPEDELARLEAIADARPDDVLLLPRPSLEVPVAATAWHRRLLCDEVEPKALRRFLAAYVNKGPERVPR